MRNARPTGGAMAQPKSHPDQFGFVFDAPVNASAAGELAGLERAICEGVAEILNSDGRRREVIAVEMAALLDDDSVSRAMLDAYASPARDQHRVPMSRFFALVAVTQRHDVFDRLTRKIGAAVLVEEEVMTARLGHLDRQIEQLKAEQRRLRSSAPLIRGN